MQKEEAPAEPETKKELTLGKGKLPEEQAPKDKPTLKPPMLITPEVVHTHTLNAIPHHPYFMFIVLFSFCSFVSFNAHPHLKFQMHLYTLIYFYFILNSICTMYFLHHFLQICVSLVYLWHSVQPLKPIGRKG